MRKAHKVDANQKEIVQEMRRLGASVQHLTDLGKGAPDLLIGWRGNNYLMEIKNEGGKNIVADSQQIWMDDWHGQVAVIRTTKEAIAFLIARHF